jgi:hypothetical protein
MNEDLFNNPLVDGGSPHNKYLLFLPNQTRQTNNPLITCVTHTSINPKEGKPWLLGDLDPGEKGEPHQIYKL